MFRWSWWKWGSLFSDDCDKAKHFSVVPTSSAKKEPNPCPPRGEGYYFNIINTTYQGSRSLIIKEIYVYIIVKTLSGLYLSCIWLYLSAPRNGRTRAEKCKHKYVQLTICNSIQKVSKTKDSPNPIFYRSNPGIPCGSRHCRRLRHLGTWNLALGTQLRVL